MASPLEAINILSKTFLEVQEIEKKAKLEVQEMCQKTKDYISELVDQVPQSVMSSLQSKTPKCLRKKRPPIESIQEDSVMELDSMQSIQESDKSLVRSSRVQRSAATQAMKSMKVQQSISIHQKQRRPTDNVVNTQFSIKNIRTLYKPKLLQTLVIISKLFTDTDQEAEKSRLNDRG